MLEKEYIDMFTQGYEGYANAFTVDTLLHLSTVFPLPNARHQCISSFRLSPNGKRANISDKWLDVQHEQCKPSGDITYTFYVHLSTNIPF